MSDLDKIDLSGRASREEPTVEHVSVTRDRGEGGSPWRWVVVLVVLLAIGGAIVLWWPSRGAEEPEAQIGAGTPEPTPEAAPAVDQEPPEPAYEVPALDASDAMVRELVARISSHPRLASWLANDDLVRRFVKVVANVAWDEDPRFHVPFLRPREGFEADPTDGVLRISRRSAQRYDLFADALVSLNVQGSSEIYRNFSPLMREAYRELGYPGTWESTLERAADKILATPVTDPEIRLAVVSYRYADPEIEGLSHAQKLLLRMGPENVERVQSKVRDLMTAIGRPPGE